MPMNEFDLGNERRIWRICRKLLLNRREQERYNTLSDVVSTGESLAEITLFTRAVVNEHTKSENGQRRQQDESVLTEAHADDLKKLVLNKIKTAADNDSLLRVPHLNEVLDFWLKNTDGKDIKEWCGRIVNGPNTFPVFVEQFLGLRSNSTSANNIKTSYRLNPKWFEPYVNPQSVIVMARQTSPSSHAYKEMTVRQRAAVNQLLLEAEMIENGLNPDDSFAWRG